VLAVLAQFLDPGGGPQETGDFELSPTPFITIILLGFVIGGIGHMYRSKTMVATGVLMILLATVLLPLYYAVSR
jgi:hypothetical protein